MPLRSIWCPWLRLQVSHPGCKGLLDWLTSVTATDLPLQINSQQHQDDLSIHHPGGSTNSGPGSFHLVPGLLQLAPCWCACMCHLTSAVHPECSTSTYQSSPALHHPCASCRWLFESNLTPCYLPTAATKGSDPSYIQDTGQRQKHGCTMGSPLPLIVAKLYMEDVEGRALNCDLDMWTTTWVKVKTHEVQALPEHITSADSNIKIRW